MISHDHYDHLDYKTIKNLEDKFNPIFITGEKVSEIFSKIVPKSRRIELNWWQEIEVINDCKITFVPAHHWSKRSLIKNNSSLWGGFVISNEKENIFFAGDTAYSKHFKDIKDKFNNIDIAILPIGAYKPEWFMKYYHTSPKEVVEIAKELNLNQVIPMHYGCFKGLADDGFTEPLEELNYYINKFSLNPEHFIILKPGEYYQL